MAAEFLLRFLFSCLVDADVLDTQAHREATGPRLGTELDGQAMLDRFLVQREAYLRTRPAGKMDARRERVFTAALAAADDPPGLYRLTAPTGTAKTIAGAAFALRHAARHSKRRVIVAVPFITITEQNANVYRDLLDPDDPTAEPVVLEHHSHVEIGEPALSSRQHSWRKFAAENWSVPFVVTTTVQLFESLFGRTASRVRKLHRIANSVIILDEVQALPHRLLPQIADALRILSTRFGVTVVLSSATQPEVRAFSPLKDLDAPELVPEPATLFAECRRVRYEWRVHPRRPTLAQAVAEAATHRQVLMVLNTVRDTRTAFLTAREIAATETSVLHLSTAMCPAHRRYVLNMVRGLLRDNASILLASTSLVEAGVDLDFPVAFRAIGPPESLAQVAGRCNREDSLGDRGGLMIIFDPVDGGLPPSYRTQIDKAWSHFGPDLAEPEDQEALREYFPQLYRTLGIDAPGSPARVIRRNRRRWDFRAVADGPLKQDGRNERDRELAFRMIVEDTVPVVVHYGGQEAEETIQDCLARLRGPQPDMKAFRRLQPYVTTLRRGTTRAPEIAAQLAPVIGDLVEWRGDYDEGYGIVLEPRVEDYLL